MRKCRKYQSFSEVRLFIFNIQKKDSFSFNIIIPEDDFIKFNRGTAKYDPQVISVLKQLACDIWQWEYVDAIQTSLELSDGDVSFDKIEKGELPSAEPFAIYYRYCRKTGIYANNEQGTDRTTGC